MKTTIAVLLAIAASFARGAVSGTPEVDNANGVAGPRGHFVSKTCPGEHGTSYVTYRGDWIGTNGGAFLDPGTDLGEFAGTFQFKNIEWTINRSTGDGVLTGGVRATDSVSGSRAFTGKLTAVTKGTLDPTGTNPVPGRGMLVAGLAPADDGAPPPGDDSLVANVELQIWPGRMGVFIGDRYGSSPPVANWSVVSNLIPAAGTAC